MRRYRLQIYVGPTIADAVTVRLQEAGYAADAGTAHVYVWSAGADPIAAADSALGDAGLWEVDQSRNTVRVLRSMEVCAC